MQIPETSQQFKIESDELSLKELIFKFRNWLYFLRTKWLIIVVFSTLAGVVGYISAYLKKPIYTAQTSFVLEENSAQSTGGQYAGLASMVGIDLGGGGGSIFQGENIFELYKSRNMVRKTLLDPIKVNGRSTNLMQLYIENNNLKKLWEEKPDLLQLDFGPTSNDTVSSNRHLTPPDIRKRDSVLNEVVKDINNNYLKISKPDKKLSIIQVEVRSDNEQFAKLFNDHIVTNVNEFYVQTKMKKSIDNVGILQQKVDSIQTVLRGAIYKAAIVSDETPNLNPTRQVKRLVPLQNAQFSAETNKSMLAELLKNLELSKISMRKDAPLIQVVDQPIYPLSVQYFSKIRSALIWAVLAGFIVVIYLSIHKVLKDVLNN